jgi:hypothetical protein
MKFLVLNYSCLQNPWLWGYRPQIPVLSVLCPQLNLLNPLPLNKIPGYATEIRYVRFCVFFGRLLRIKVWNICVKFYRVLTNTKQSYYHPNIAICLSHSVSEIHKTKPGVSETGFFSPVFRLKMGAGTHLHSWGSKTENNFIFGAKAFYLWSHHTPLYPKKSTEPFSETMCFYIYMYFFFSKSCIVRDFMVCAPHQILFEWSNQEKDGWGMGHVWGERIGAYRFWGGGNLN